MTRRSRCSHRSREQLGPARVREDRGGPAPDGVRGELRTVRAGAGEGHEQVPVLDDPVVRGHAGDRSVSGVTWGDGEAEGDGEVRDLVRCHGGRADPVDRGCHGEEPTVSRGWVSSWVWALGGGCGVVRAAREPGSRQGWF